MKSNFLYQFAKVHTSRYFKQLYFQIQTVIDVYGKLAIRIVLLGYHKLRYGRYPTMIQLPITYKCNFDCVMCGMQKLSNRSGFSPIELKDILSDRLYKKVTVVGVNGGEPFLLKNLEKYIEVLTETLPSLKNIYIISNGYFTDRIIDKMPLIYKLCRQKKVHLQLSISVDGVGEMQDMMRGKKSAFEKVSITCQELTKNKAKYCDSFALASTIAKVNAYHLVELDAWAKENKYPIVYNVAAIHKRVCNGDKIQDFSLFTDPHARMMAAEFLYSKYLETKSEQYFGLYYYVKYGVRISSCYHQKSVVTLTPNGALSYCATHSNELGNALANSSYNIFFDKENLVYRKKLHKEKCKECSQYGSNLRIKEYLLLYAKDRMREVRIFR